MAEYTPNGSTIIPGIDLDVFGNKVQAIQNDGTYKWVTGANSPTPKEDLIWGTDGSINIRLLSGAANVKNLGAVGNGVADDTAAFAAAAVLAGTIIVPPGQYRLTSTITITNGTRFIGMGVRGQQGLNTRAVVLDHDFNGTMFNVTGVSGDVVAGTGTAFENITFRQVNGNGSGASGTCIRLLATSDTFYPSWVNISDCNIEVQAGKNDWTQGLDIDGTGTSGTIPGFGMRDVWVTNSRITTGTNSTRAVNLNTAANINLVHCFFNGTNSIINVTGADAADKRSSGLYITNCSGNTLALDRCLTVHLLGGIWTTLTHTSDVTASLLMPNSITNAPATPAATSVTIATRVNSTGRYSVISGGPAVVSNMFLVGNPAFVAGASTGDIVLQNLGRIVAANGAGNGNLNLIGSNGSDQVLIGQSGTTVDIRWNRALVGLGGGATPTFGTIGGSGPATAGQNSWMRVIDNTGAAFWVPAWK